MNTRVALTAIWLASLLAAVILIESYFFRATPTGLPFLLPGDRPAIYGLLAALYGSNIGAVLAAWYVKPFPPPRQLSHARFIAGVAICITVAYNLILLYLIGQGHVSQADSIDSLLDRAKAVGSALAFLTIPVNGYYFGTTQNS